MLLFMGVLRLRRGCFNEAPALRRGKSLHIRGMAFGPTHRFNEAPALRRGKWHLLQPNQLAVRHPEVRALGV